MWPLEKLCNKITFPQLPSKRFYICYSHEL
jgi:hypothetical protein